MVLEDIQCKVASIYDIMFSLVLRREEYLHSYSSYEF